MKRRQLLAAGLGLLAGSACSRRVASDPAQRATDFLLSQQQSDGSWRSQQYRDMTSGYELTPMIAKALAFSGHDMARAGHFMQAGVGAELVYPTYTAALMLLWRGREASGWRGRLLELQLNKANGFASRDPDFGGWGYAQSSPRPGKAHSNVTSTCFAVGALGPVAGALQFVRGCQCDDGGFCAAAADPVLDKAGPRVSYGSATADGLRCLYRLGAKPDEIARAEQWLVKNFSAEVHPGAFPPARYEDRDSLLYYYFWSLAHALAAAARRGQPLPGTQAMFAAMSERLRKLQRADGSLVNSLGATREDDPLVATPMALAVWKLQGMVGALPKKPA